MWGKGIRTGIPFPCPNFPCHRCLNRSRNRYRL
jgi:hypothetical protein